jgi:hypothetical protein
MKKITAFLTLLLPIWSFVHAQVTTSIIIETTPTLSQPSNTTLGPSAIFDYTIDGSGLLSLDHSFANSAGTGVAAWGDALDFTGAAGLTAGDSGTFRIRIYGFDPAGAAKEVKSNDGLGMGVGGQNSSRMDRGTNSGESFQLEITTTGLPTSVNLVITGLRFGNANAISTVQPEASIASLVNMSGYTGTLGAITTGTTPPQDFNIPNGGLTIAGGGGVATTGSFVLSQANQPTSGTVGFSLQGITFDVVPVAVPEPSTIAIFAGLGALTVAVVRRRHLRK